MAAPGALTVPTLAATPTTPSAGKQSLFCDNTTARRTKAVDEAGVVKTFDERYLANYLRNSDLRFAQRQQPGSATTYSNLTGRAISADGWGVTNENASVQYIRAATSSSPETGLQSATYGTWSKITNTGKIVLSQVIENTDSMPTRGRVVRFQVSLKASASKTMKIAVIQNKAAATANAIAATFISAFGANNVDPTLGTNLGFLAPVAGVTGDNCTADTNSFICSVTTSWQRFGGCVTVPTDLKNLIVVVWTDTQFAAADTFSMSQASLTDGYEIQDFNTLPYQMEMYRCLRFYCKSFSIDQNPTQAVGVNSGEIRSIAGKAGALAEFIPINFQVEMISAPAVTLYSPASANTTARDITAAADSAATTATGFNVRNGYISFNGAAGTAVGNLLGIHYSADSEI